MGGRIVGLAMSASRKQLNPIRKVYLVIPGQGMFVLSPALILIFISSVISGLAMYVA